MVCFASLPNIESLGLIHHDEGKRTINQIAAALQISQPLADRAFQIYKLAVFYNFVQGRRIRNVAAVALYMTCRKEKGNSMMLIDFSDVLNVR